MDIIEHPNSALTDDQRTRIRERADELNSTNFGEAVVLFVTVERINGTNYRGGHSTPISHHAVVFHLAETKILVKKSEMSLL